jgi:Flp pilus assembly protein TadD
MGEYRDRARRSSPGRRHPASESALMGSLPLDRLPSGREKPRTPMDDDDPEAMDQISAHLDRGWDLATRGDYLGALKCAERVLSIRESSAEAHNLLGFVYAAQGRAEDALQHYRHALEIDEGFFEALLNAAEVLLHPLGDYEEALATVDEALDWAESELEQVEVLLLRADILFAGGDLEQARQALQGLPEEAVKEGAHLLTFGRLHLELGDPSTAARALHAATEAGAPPGEAHYHLGRALEQLDDQRGAQVAFLQAREADLADPRPPWAMAQGAFEGRVQQAMKRLPEEISQLLEGALVVVTDAPGAEVVAEGIDPRASVLADGVSPPTDALRIDRLFVYQRNVERVAPGTMELDEEIVAAVTAEVRALSTPPDEPPTPAS